MSNKLLYSIGEVAQMLGQEVSAVRYWSKYFSRYIKPERNAKGNRLYHPEDVECLKTVQYLLKEQGLTLDGVARRLAADKGELDKRMAVIGSLTKIKTQLGEIYSSL